MPSPAVPTKESCLSKVRTRFNFLCSVVYPRVPLATQAALERQVCYASGSAIARAYTYECTVYALSYTLRCFCDDVWACVRIRCLVC
jgi:hypothetical protein